MGALAYEPWESVHGRTGRLWGPTAERIRKRYGLHVPIRKNSEDDRSAMATPVWVTGAGVGAAFCSMGSFTPQLVKIWRERDAAAVSWRMFALTVLGFSLWIVYGVALRGWPLVLSNTVCLGLSAAILWSKWKLERGEVRG